MVACLALCQPSLRARLATAAFSGKLAAQVPTANLRLNCVVARAGKGFDTKSDSKPQAPAADSAPAAPSASTADALDAVEALEQKIRNRRAKQRAQEAKVKVNAPVVDAVSNKDGTAPPEAQFETFLVGFLLYFFLFVLVEGLVISAAGFLPEDWDAFITDVLYPNYSTTVLGFLGCSSLYGLWKTGKLPGQPGGGSSS